MVKIVQQEKLAYKQPCVKTIVILIKFKKKKNLKKKFNIKKLDNCAANATPNMTDSCPDGFLININFFNKIIQPVNNVFFIKKGYYWDNS